MTEVRYDTFPLDRNYRTGAVAMWRYMMNKEDSVQAFKYFDAVCGPQMERNFKIYAESPEGKKRIEKDFNLIEVLSDDARLSALPPNTLGNVYYRFMKAEGLSAKGLYDIEVEANIRTLHLEPHRKEFMRTSFQLHDMIHVVGGYGRDFVGEGCNFAFAGVQLGLASGRAMGWAVGIKEKTVYPKLPVLACIREAEKRSQKAKWIMDKDWDAYLEMDIEDVRADLNLDPPHIYNAHKETFGKVDAYRRDKLMTGMA